MSLPLSSQWYWQAIYRIQGTFDTVATRYAATAASAVVFALVVAVLYYLGSRLKDRHDADTVEVVQSLLVTTTAVLLTGFLVAVWRIPDDVLNALEFLSISPEQGVKALVTFIVFAGGVTVTRLTKRSIKYGAGRVAITPHQRAVAHHAIQIVVFIPFVAFVVALWGIPVTNLFLGAGVLGIVFGFAARKTLSGILSGFVILFARPFEVGDWIRVADREGIVTDITVYNTQIRTFNEEHVLVPNDAVTENEIVNYSKTDRLRLETDVGIDYETDIGTAARIAVEAMERVEAVAEQPPPDVIRHEFADSAVILRLRYWITTPRVQEKWRAQNAVIESVKAEFEANGIKIPFPQRELTGRAEETDRSKRLDRDSADPAGTGSENGSVSTPATGSVTDPPADEDAK
ncbi:mechanosensitive ion channel family protein [Natronomonas sp. F2-12]|jgi:small-conductance mechanosensitive channel|uniref:Mechanosensitive ion channel family protein n=1 Tax=Natronomonas aquatica TaxID=2841590 RepID=A0A9R1D6L9_9EURY|nr:mechanosensitive ion channel family protein [Natronomonas aquatica]MCQ4333598.1 mechanosensitive ion channel family protein [Natronomonas aquatica]